MDPLKWTPFLCRPWGNKPPELVPKDNSPWYCICILFAHKKRLFALLFPLCMIRTGSIIHLHMAYPHRYRIINISQKPPHQKRQVKSENVG
jgi:hypothetical protein